MRVFVYFNLTRKCWSVRAAEGPEKGRVIAHCSHVGLQDCKFLVSERQRQKVVATGKETVHAGIRGIMVKLVGTPTEAGQRLGYEPTIQTTPNN